jgi:hypothetical protein
MLFSVRHWGVGSLLALLVLATTLMAAEGRGRPAKIGPVDPDAETVEMFAAIDKGDIEVKLVQKDSKECHVSIKNNTKKPLNVKLPEAFAGVPVLGQAGAMGGAPGGTRKSSSGSSKGGGGGSQGSGGGMMGGGGGMMGLPPEQVAKLTVPTVCLDHGKREPQASMAYVIKPLESYSTKAGVRELCEMVGSGQIDQRAAQAAAWHLNSGMSWQELANKRVRHAGVTQSYFTQAELQAGMQIAASAISIAKEREKNKTPSSKTGPESVTSQSK